MAYFGTDEVSLGHFRGEILSESRGVEGSTRVVRDVNVFDNSVWVHYVEAAKKSPRDPVDFGLGGIELPQHFEPLRQARS
jgi:hypothetical protein